MMKQKRSSDWPHLCSTMEVFKKINVRPVDMLTRCELCKKNSIISIIIYYIYIELLCFTKHLEFPSHLNLIPACICWGFHLRSAFCFPSVQPHWVVGKSETSWLKLFVKWIVLDCRLIHVVDDNDFTEASIRLDGSTTKCRWTEMSEIHQLFETKIWGDFFFSKNIFTNKTGVKHMLIYLLLSFCSFNVQNINKYVRIYNVYIYSS